MARQRGAHAFGVSLAQLLQGLGREFFGQQFDQQGRMFVVIYAVSPAAWSRSSMGKPSRSRES